MLIERVIVLARGKEITLEDLPPNLRQEPSELDRLQLELPDSGISLEGVERELIEEAVDTESAGLDIQLLRRPDDGLMLELIEYTEQPSKRAAHNSRVGAAHLAFVVSDIHSAYEALRADGVHFLSAPNTDRYGELWVYLRDPDGIVLELMQPRPDSARTVAT